MLLETKKVSKAFGGLMANNEIDFGINEGEIVAIIGPNGSGKTTFYNLLTGISPATSGSITFKGKDITRCKPEEITKMGISRTFQNIRLFGDLTVAENIIIARHCRRQSGMLDALFNTKRVREEEAENQAFIEKCLNYVGIYDKKDWLAKNLPYGMQRRLEIARALATEPSLILLDEPAAGMNPQETLELAEFIKEIRDQFHKTILLIEHHMDLVMGIADRIYVLDFGKLIAQGTPEEIQNNERVIDAYLGVAEDA